MNELELEKLRQMLEAMLPGPEKDILQQRLEALSHLPPDQQAEAVKNLSMDYEGRTATLRDDLEKNYAMLSSASPQAIDGPSGNPYAYTTAASPIEHLASGALKYMGGRGVKEDKAALEKLSKSQESGLGAVLEGGLKNLTPEEQTAYAEWLRKKRYGLVGA